MSDPLALDGGSWRPVGGVLRWVPEESPPKPKPVDVGSLLACPFCRAKAAETCKSSGGNAVAPHATRLVGRYCPCGERLLYRRGSRRKLCDACRDEEARASKRRTRALRSKCGTDSGYRRHRRLGQDACGPCLEAHAHATRRNKGERTAA